MLILGLFAGSRMWGNEEEFIGLYELTGDEWLRRCLILAIGMSGQDFWLRTKKVHLDSMTEWEKRAFLYSCSILPKDEMKAYFNAIRNSLSFLDGLVINFSKLKPISQ